MSPRTGTAPPTGAVRPTRRCRDCAAWLLPRRVHNALPAPERRQCRAHAGQGLCRGCWDARRADGTLIDVERLTRRWQDTVADHAILTARGLDAAEVAATLGLSRQALRWALRDAERAGA